MSTRLRAAPRRRPTGRAISVWLIALLVALVATVQIRSQAEVERSLVGIDTTSLAFLIDDLHRANDSLQTEAADLQSRGHTAVGDQRGGGPGAQRRGPPPASDRGPRPGARPRRGDRDRRHRTDRAR